MRDETVLKECLALWTHSGVKPVPKLAQEIVEWQAQAVKPEDGIVMFRGKNRWLSNFHEAPIHADGKVYPTTEHYYQSFKTQDPVESEYLRGLPTPLEVMNAGRRTKTPWPPEAWDAMKVQIMYRALLLKFTQHSDLAAKLIATKDAYLIEGNLWGDKVWGQSPIGYGDNRLGKLLMSVRTTVKGIYLNV